MKKIILSISIVSLLFSCGGNEQSSEEVSNETEIVEKVNNSLEKRITSFPITAISNNRFTLLGDDLLGSEGRQESDGCETDPACDCCSEDYFLNDNFEFYSYGGCAPDSWVTKGGYIVKDDTLILTYNEMEITYTLVGSDENGENDYEYKKIEPVKDSIMIRKFVLSGWCKNNIIFNEYPFKTYREGYKIILIKSDKMIYNNKGNIITGEGIPEMYDEWVNESNK